ncbi:aldehyde ferredoxin oxidoreductase N-terminal domain-containing protein, partial [Bullifex sp.]|uniref:aldehyde ferredoxin oxidoreductase N-terminal domain-containing protein n=1 Tax=Bullifex sp. TaxID=2815808 RepID=UPI002A8376DD
MEKKIIIADLTEQKIIFSSIECDKEGLELALFLQDGDDIVFAPVENRFINSGYLIVFNSLYDNKITYQRGNSDLLSFFYSENISALLVKGNARKLSYISIRDDELAINSCEKLRANGINHTFEIISKGDDGVLAIGEAGEK